MQSLVVLHRFRPLLALASFAALNAPTNASADNPALADALFREARALYKAGNYPEACPKFAESQRLEPAPGTLYNLAECEEKQGKIASALERWRTLIDMLSASNKLADPRLPVAKGRVAALTKRVPRLVLKMSPSAPRESIALLDGVELRAASLDTPLPVEPGAHTIVARAAYRHDGEFKISLKEAEQKELVIEPGSPDGTGPGAPASRPAASASAAPTPTVAPTPPPTATASAGPSAPIEAPPAPGSGRTLGLIVAGAGVASFIGAGVTGVMLNARRDTIEKHCDAATRLCDAEGARAASSNGGLLGLNVAFWALGAAGVGVGSYLFFTSPSGASAQVGIGAPGALWVQGRF